MFEFWLVLLISPLFAFMIHGGESGLFNVIEGSCRSVDLSTKYCYIDAASTWYRTLPSVEKVCRSIFLPKLSGVR